MTDPPRPSQREDFEIAIICALPSEADAVEALFDKCWDDEGLRFGKAAGDRNAYSTGVIGCHNVVLAWMPGMGKGSAAIVAASCGFSFGGIKLALVVGICGGVPYGTDHEKEILLGDVIISDGLVEYDFGRKLPDKFLRKDTLKDNRGRPNTEIRALLAKLKGYKSRTRLKDNTSDYLAALCQKPGFEKAQYPGADEDKLYEPTYRHKHHDSTCNLCDNCKKKGDEVCETALDSSCIELKCSENKQVTRNRLLKIKEIAAASTKGCASTHEAVEAQRPVIHYGLIASGDTVMKSGEDRDGIADQRECHCF
jgi:nucleoside phosphorylase